jgi:hypothetical protein
MNDGIDNGTSTGERFGHFVYWLVLRHGKEKFTDESVTAMLQSEFPNRVAAGGQRTFQTISAYRGYAVRYPKSLGVRGDAGAAEVLARIDRKMGYPVATQV